VIVGITGPAGAGKSTTSHLLAEHAMRLSVPLQVLPLDAFFRLSSRARKEWLAEGERIGGQELARRSDMTTWWDFDRLVDVINRLRRMEVVHLYNIYNREDGGDLTGELTIDLHGGGILVVEGVAVAHLRAQGLVDILIYVETREDIRRVRLLQRDGDRRRGVEAEKRWRLTQAFEQRYFAEYKRLADFRLNNDNE